MMDPIEGAISLDALADQIADGLGDDLDYEREPTPDTDADDGADADPQSEQDDPDEAEGDEAEEGDEEEGDGEEETQNPEIDDDTLVDIKIGDEEYEVNFAELRAGYLRNEEFVSRSQKLESEHQAKIDELEQTRDELLQELLAASTIVTSDVSQYEKVDWAALKAQDPDKYAQLRVQALEAKEQATALETRRKNVQAIQNKARELKYQAYAEQQLAIAAKTIPDFDKDETKTALAKYALDIGYTAEEIYGIVDARHLLLLHQALQHTQSAIRRKEAGEKKVTKNLPPVNKSAASVPQNHADRAASKAKLARFKQDKSVESAAALLAASFD